MQEVYNKIIEGIRKYFKENNFKKAVIGLSGGIDSALSLKLIVDALGNKNATVLIMPEKELTKKQNIKDAVEFCKSLKVNYKIIEINQLLNNFKKISIEQNKVSWVNLKPRIRMLVLYNYANANNALVIGTSNKTELMLGYFTKYGDGACDLEVIGDLYKTELIKLAEFLKLPERIIKKQPTAELFHGQTDEKELGASYEQIDAILKMIEGKKRVKRSLAEKIIKRIKENEHKRKAIPIIRVR